MPTTVELNYHRTGDGPPVVILHGLFGSARNWQSLARKLANEFTVITVDLRNHGGSPHATTMDYLTLAADVAALLGRLQLTEVALIGHSMGGKTAMSVALSAPKRIARLVIVDIGPGAYPNDYHSMLEAMVALDMSSIKRQADADSALASAIPDNAIRSFILQNIVVNELGQRCWRINLQAIRSNIEKLVGAIPSDKMSRFDGPAYFIRGAKSDRVDERELATIGTLFPDYQLITIANAGHWPHIEAPDEFISHLRPRLK